MQTRESDDDLNGLLEFPGGKIEDGESAEEASVREVNEETGVELAQEEIVYYKTHENLNIFLYEDIDSKFKAENWYQLSFLDDLESVADRIPPENIIFLKEFLNSNKFKMLVNI